ncbi:MAG: Aminopeptidase family protein [Chloroflexi bacterium]|nr:Aminopeptidase family protein [Chloroflexota bacterium]
MDASSRLSRVRGAMQEAELPALLVAQPESRRYLSGYTAADLSPRESAGYLLITDDRQYLLTDPRTEGGAAEEAPSFDLQIYRSERPLSEVIRDLLVASSARSLGVEADYVPHGLWLELAESLHDVADLKPSGPLVDRLRMVKDANEMEALRASISLNDAAFSHLVHTVHPGMAETALAWELEDFVRRHGAEGVSFDPITVGGPNTAIPHAVPSDRPIRADELVLFDIGTRLGGYCSDMTRTFCIDSVQPRLREIWNVVLDAQLAAEAAARPGMSGRDVDAVARNVIEKAGYGEAFVHGTGHGVGLEIHEPPWITHSRGADVLLPGMVFSIEPGVYLPGLGGVRIEDLVVLTESGAEVLCASPKRLALADILSELENHTSGGSS